MIDFASRTRKTKISKKMQIPEKRFTLIEKMISYNFLANDIYGFIADIQRSDNKKGRVIADPALFLKFYNY